MTRATSSVLGRGLRHSSASKRPPYFFGGNRLAASVALGANALAARIRSLAVHLAGPCGAAIPDRTVSAQIRKRLQASSRDYAPGGCGASAASTTLPSL
jgi:hypothetical protein